jgi:hypothetical protein
MTAARLPALDNDRFSPPVGLWCPWCRTPFVGSVDRTTGHFAHGDCPVAALDVARLDALAATSWFWERFRDRLQG